jgi:hypothetical protein
VINKGIGTFENYFNARTKKIFSTHKKKITQLSNELMKKTGLKAGEHEFLPQPLDR